MHGLPLGYERLVEGYFVGGMLGTFSCWVANPSMQDALAQRVPGTASEYAARYNRGNSFWFS
ncbi:MAG: hypothetical protein QGI88_03975 [SAR202 cluster bacterium]|nr:hypothetical protein [SAR202 cluster bacterium]